MDERCFQVFLLGGDRLLKVEVKGGSDRGMSFHLQPHVHGVRFADGTTRVKDGLTVEQHKLLEAADVSTVETATFVKGKHRTYHSSTSLDRVRRNAWRMNFTIGFVTEKGEFFPPLEQLEKSFRILGGAKQFLPKDSEEKTDGPADSGNGTSPESATP